MDKVKKKTFAALIPNHQFLFNIWIHFHLIDVKLASYFVLPFKQIFDKINWVYGYYLEILGQIRYTKTKSNQNVLTSGTNFLICFLNGEFHSLCWKQMLNSIWIFDFFQLFLPNFTTFEYICINFYYFCK